MMIILFLALNLIHESFAQLPTLNQLEAGSCGLTEVPAIIPDDWIESDLPVSQEEASARIYNGTAADHREMPWIVHLVGKVATIPNFVAQGCTGSLISRQWVISAGHCMFYTNTETLRFEWFGNSDTEIGAGPRDYTTVGFQWKTRSRYYFVPNDFRQQVETANNQQTSVAKLNDIALIRLEQPMNPTYQALTNRFLINYICLPSRGPDINRIYRVAGYGDLGAVKNSESLWQYETRIRNYTECNIRFYEYLFIWLKASFNDPRFEMPQVYNQIIPPEDVRIVCTVPFDTPSTTCPGDSGGPLSVQRPDTSDPKWELTGVTHGGAKVQRQFLIRFLAQFRHYGGDIPANANLRRLADQILPRYNRDWPCSHLSYFNLLNGYQDWIVQTIQENTNGDTTISWLYYAVILGAVGGLGTRRLVGTYRHEQLPQQPALEAAPEEGGQQEPGQLELDAGPQQI